MDVICLLVLPSMMDLELCWDGNSMTEGSSEPNTSEWKC